MDKIEFAEVFKARTKRFAIDIIRLHQRLPKSEEARIIGRQLIRAATSVAANYRAVCRARSDNEFFAKISLTVEEADEVVFWLEMLNDAKIYDVESELMKESIEILSILAKSRKTAKK